jgi:AmmeMemoRadiSam system protein B
MISPFRLFNYTVLGLALGSLWTGNVTKIQAASHIPDSWCNTPPSYTLRGDYPRGVVLPHHTLAAQLWTPVWEQWAQYPPQRIIIFSPNHNSTSSHDIVSTTSQNGTAKYPLLLDEELITQLKTANLIGTDFATVATDQGVSAFVPELQKNFPTTKVVPLLFKKNTSLKKIKALVAALAKNANQETVYVASVDFVHDLPPTIAWQNDQKTIQLLQTGQWPKLQGLSSSYLDAPTALIAFGYLMQTQYLEGRLVAHAHAGQFLNDCYTPTTSYQVWSFE